MEYPTYLIHYGIPGQKWGERKYQNEDGTWTQEGKERRRVGQGEHSSNKADNVKTRTKNYIKTIKSLSDKEFQLYIGNPSVNKKQDINNMKRNIKLQPNYRDALEIVSKNGNVTTAWLNQTGFGKEWKMQWATNPNARGTGVTQSNLKEVISLIREHSDLPISAIIAPDNMPSIKTAEKAGFIETMNVYDPRTKQNEKKYVYGKEHSDKMKKQWDNIVKEYKNKH